MLFPRIFSAGHPSTGFDRWVAMLFVAHFSAALVFIPFFPGQLQDPDLLAYFIYFRDWVSGSSELHGASYFNHPKPLLIFLLGPLGSQAAAAIITACAAGLLGSVIYLVGRGAFGWGGGLLWSALLLGDPSRIFLALKSGADFYLTLLLFLAIWLVMSSRFIAGATSVLLAALVKPVAIPCALAFLVVPGGRARRAACIFLPFLAIPLTLALNHSLMGGAFLPGNYLQEFSALREIPGIRPDALPKFVFWNVLVEHRFGGLVVLGFAGMGIWLSRDPARLRSPLFLMPILLFSGYFALAIFSPYLPFFRFFWVLDVWILGFIVFCALEVGKWLSRWRVASAVAVVLIVLLVLAKSFAGYLRYRDTFARPMERDTGLARAAAEELARVRTPQETVLCPLGFQPFLMWTQQAGGPGNPFWTAEASARAGLVTDPDWIFDIPAGYLSASARQLVERLKSSGHYQVHITQEEGALYRRTK